ncbi:hypothetical protein RVIR1_05750 [Candidatus Rickettsiella viridis]|uniref:Uncharacterized protein n=1 Tax=Candidatus Rickettsiella viridis TaxID=676208 RepID=A0A2Z5V721_9COXI|nr:hypothetical protein [Candidatus Rickettsiella viridis]BBB15077.1 hypothetical protein RVIR1_05750 [Candidatus Rickettsiella viridis]
MLKENTKLISFKLGGLYKDQKEINQSIIAIMEVLEKNNSLISIDLNLHYLSKATRINSSGAQAVAKMLKKK